MNIVCDFCGKQFTKKIFSTHIGKVEKHNFSTKEEKIRFICDKFYGVSETEKQLQLYKNELVSADELNKSGFVKVVELLAVLGLKRSNSQEKKTKRYQQKCITSLKKKYGPDVVNVFQLESVKKKKADTYTRKYGSEEQYYALQREKMLVGYTQNYKGSARHKQALLRASSICLEKYGHENFGMGNGAKIKASKTRAQTIAQWSDEEKRLRTQKAREAVKYESSLERRVQKALIDLDEDFIKHQFLYGYNFDLMLRGKILIEVNGDFWHANPFLYKETDILLDGLSVNQIWTKDRKKIDRVHKEGYRVIVFWETELNSLTDMELIGILSERLSHARSAS